MLGWGGHGGRIGTWAAHATSLVSATIVRILSSTLILIVAHSYQYTFEPNPKWSALYAPAAEIQAYLEGVAKKYSADRFINLRHEIKECRWNDKTAKWTVQVKNLATGETFEDQSDVVISARGNLNTPSWPDIQGLDTFEGEVMHSAAWNEKYVPNVLLL